MSQACSVRSNNPAPNISVYNSTIVTIPIGLCIHLHSITDAGKSNKRWASLLLVFVNANDTARHCPFTSHGCR